MRGNRHVLFEGKRRNETRIFAYREAKKKNE